MSDDGTNPATLHDLLIGWPYAGEYDLQTMNADLIEDHAEMHLARALNTNNVVAFVSNGVSMSYGRISWKDLVEQLVEVANIKAKQWTKEGKHKIEPYRTLIANLNQLSISKRNINSPIKSDRYPAMFQLCAEVAQLEDRMGSYVGGLADTRSNIDDPFDRDVKKRTRDSHFHSLEAVKKIIEIIERENPKESSSIELDSNLIKQIHEKITQIELFLFSENIDFRLHILNIENLFDNLRGMEGVSPTLRRTRMIESINILNEKDQNEVIIKINKWLKILSDDIENYIEINIFSKNGKNTSAGAKYSSGSKSEPRSPHVIEGLSKIMNIRRFLTTNYDLEIERQAHLDGFRPLGQTADFVTQLADETQRRARDFVIGPRRPGVLVDFSIREGRYTYDIAHLHGRALPGEPIVASETQYQNLYVKPTPNRDLLEQAISLAFRGNTVLFVGSGMGEDDILRPLRHFVSEGPSAENPPAIALLPHGTSDTSRIEEKVALLRRYGAYTIHFGYGSLDPKDPLKKIPLLPEVKLLIREMSNLLSKYKSSKKVNINRLRNEFIDLFQISLKDDAKNNTPKISYLIEPVLSEDCKKLMIGYKVRNLIAIEDINLKGKEFPRAESRQIMRVDAFENAWSILQEVFQFSIALVGPKSSMAEHKARLIWAEAALTELDDAITAAFLTAKIWSLAWSWRRWRETWFADIRPREAKPRGTKRPDKENSSESEGEETVARAGAQVSDQQFVMIDCRHELKHDVLGTLPSGIAYDKTKRREYRPTYSQTFRDYVLALAAEFKGMPPSEPLRRIHILVGPRGLGKGHFYQALSTPDALEDFRKAIRPRSPERRLYYHGCNLSFSIEVASAFDRIILFLRDAIIDMYKNESNIDKAKQDREVESLQNQLREYIPDVDRGISGDRLGALRYLIDVLSGTATGSSPGLIRQYQPNGRVVIAINSFHLLFTQRGYAKNMVAFRVLEAFLRPSAATAAIDLVLIGDETHLPVEFRRVVEVHQKPPHDQVPIGGAPPPIRIRPQFMPAVSLSPFQAQEDLAALYEVGADVELHGSTGGVATPFSPDMRHSGASRRKVTPGVFIHRLRRPRISFALFSAMPRAAVLIAARGMLRNPEEDARPRIEQISSAVRKAGSFASIIFNENNKNPYENLIGQKEIVSPKKVAVILNYLIHSQVRTKNNKNKLNRYIRETLLDFGGVNKSHYYIDREFARLYRTMKRNRFAIFVVSAAIDECLCSGIEGGQTNAVKDAIQLYDEFSAVLGTSDETTREDTIIRVVIEHYHNESQKKLEYEAKKSNNNFFYRLKRVFYKHKKTDLSIHDVRKNRLGWWKSQLQQELIAALASIGQPTEADCLAMIEFKSLKPFETLIKSLSDDPRKRIEFRADLIRVALEELVRRCLVFRLHPRHDNSADGQPLLVRYAVHRLVQRYVFRRLHQPFVEFPQVDDFMPSLYASQPDDLPFPTPEARETIRDMLGRLALYPSRRLLSYGGTLPVDIRDLDDGPRITRMLRAAYGITRNLSSLAVILRAERLPQTRSTPATGIMEEHRRTLRWLLRCASLLPGQSEARWKAGAGMEITDGDRRLRESRPFFNGDIAWLYNEVGVVSLAQGRLYDAAKHFSIAKRVTQRFEADSFGGPVTNIIRLNRSLVYIEMGKARQAEAQLRELVGYSGEHLVIRWIARGYQGLQAHLRGEVDNAATCYLETIEALKSLGQNRSAAIFTRHLADLLRQRGLLDDASNTANDAVKLAIAGSHLDVYYLARVTKLRIDFARSVKSNSAFAGRLQQVQSDISDIRAYAQSMGLPRLTVETGHLDASLRLTIGDLHYANRAVTEALSLANQHGMVMKSISMMLTLARIYMLRDLRADARLLAESARNMAIETEYAVAQDIANMFLAEEAPSGGGGRFGVHFPPT